MSPIDTSGIKPGVRIDSERHDSRVRDGDNEAAKGTLPKRPDTVQLTDTAVRLAELQAEVATAEGLDLEKIEVIRQQIADGSYRIDADRIADALIAMEKELL